MFKFEPFKQTFLGGTRKVENVLFIWFICKFVIDDCQSLIFSSVCVDTRLTDRLIKQDRNKFTHSAQIPNGASSLSLSLFIIGWKQL